MFRAIFEKHYKKLALIPVVLLVISIVFLGIKYATTHEIINRDVSLKGGITATIYTEKEIPVKQLESKIPESYVRKLAEFATGKNIGYIIETSAIDEDQLKSILEQEFGLNLTQENFSVEKTGASLGQSFYKELVIAVIFAFLFMGFVVFLIFRALAPSLAVIFAALTDVIVTLAIINLINMKVTAAGIVAFLLVIGYSIDTDILLTTRTIKRKEGSFYERLVSSAKTGLTMTFTTIVALLLASIFTTSYVLKNMFTIIIIALFIDILSTYLTNAGILYWHEKRKK